MPSLGVPHRAPALPPTEFRSRASIRSRIFRQSVLLVTFCVLLLGGLAFAITTQVFLDIELHAGQLLIDPRTVSFTILILAGLLIALAFLLSTLLARSITRPLKQLSEKASSLRVNRWIFPETVQTGDEIEMLDHVIADLASRLRIAYRSLENRMRVTTEGLQRESALDSTILESIEYGVLVLDADGKVSDANPAAQRLLQLSRPEICGHPAITVLGLQSRVPYTGQAGHPALLALNGQHYHSRPIDHLRLIRHDQTFLPISLIAAPLLAPDRQFGAVIVFQDMTEERQIDYMKSEFISLASHQLRTPLSSIRWYAELLSTQDTSGLSDEQRTYVTEIFSSSVRMANLIEALLHVARIESGVLVPEKKEVDLTAFLAQTGDEWQGMIKEKGIILALALPPGPFSIQTDPVLLQIVLQNLLSNAIKYSPRGSTITLRLTSQGTHAVIGVSDQGIGILPQDRPRVFQKFFRGHNAKTVDTDGNGLGLYITRSVAVTLGGECDFETSDGNGSTFRITLPARA